MHQGRQPEKNDANDAEAIVEASSRPTMHLVVLMPAEQQVRTMVFKTRDLLVHQRSQIVNAFHGQLKDYGTLPGRIGHSKVACCRG